MKKKKKPKPKTPRNYLVPILAQRGGKGVHKDEKTYNRKEGKKIDDEE